MNTKLDTFAHAKKTTVALKSDLKRQKKLGASSKHPAQLY